jgi:sterol desaturase/sphingolipid hydroxylase (fatty acid hydroxylase superfamily)
MRPGFWQRSHHLDRMTLRELVIAYVQYPAIIIYALLTTVMVALFVGHPARPLPTLISIAAAIFVYPLVWYLLHRWVLHSRWMFKVAPFAAVWKRIHYDHHQDPNHLEVLFGALYTTLPTIVIATAPLGYLIGGIGGAYAAVAAALVTTCFYEFCHCIQHLAYKPKMRWLADIKRRHMAHHFHDESGNFGITNFTCDRLFGTFYERPQRPRKSATVFNLGYTPEMAKRWPRVAQLSGGSVAKDHPRRRPQ